MTLLLNCHSLSKAYGSRQLFTNLSFGIFQGDKIGLVGPNGAGKSTLLKVLAGLENPDKGTVACRKSLIIGYVPQASEYQSHPIDEVVFDAYKGNTHLPRHELETQVRILLSKLGFKDDSQKADALSGGWKKRLDIAKELINNPDVLFLDEPTNHLDLEGILWLEKFIKSENMAFLITSHDRYFLDNVASRIVELNPTYPQGIFCSDGNYTQYIARKEEFLNYQEQCERALASKVRGEVDWLRQSPKARTVKSSARVQEAERLIQELSNIRTRNRQGTSKIDFESSERQTTKLVAAKNIAKTLGEKELFQGVDLTLVPGMRLGIVGPNGCGKTTLLKIIAGEITPDKGTLKYANDLKVVYFDQHRQKLSLDDTLRRALSPHSDTVVYRGQNIHVNSWAKRFLFNPDRMDLPIKQLSGGERARIGIARLMLQPADLLLLDEPTNDLDIPTLETLEESLSEFPGAIVLITHDRALLDTLCNCVIGLGVPNVPPPLLADLRQWEKFVKENSGKQSSNPSKNTPANQPKTESTPVQKLNFKEKRELEQMESGILSLEKKIAELEKLTDIHNQNNNHPELTKTCHELDIANKELEQLYQRWQELDSKEKK